jgi:hypothetical protein
MPLGIIWGLHNSDVQACSGQHETHTAHALLTHAHGHYFGRFEVVSILCNSMNSEPAPMLTS